MSVAHQPGRLQTGKLQAVRCKAATGQRFYVCSFLGMSQLQYSLLTPSTSRRVRPSPGISRHGAIRRMNREWWGLSKYVSVVDGTEDYVIVTGLLPLGTDFLPSALWRDAVDMTELVLADRSRLSDAPSEDRPILRTANHTQS